MLLAFVCAQLGCVSSVEAADPRPNVIVFMIDDLGWTAAGYYGSDLYETQNIDRLAAQPPRRNLSYGP